jgi:hypothetical protein
MRLSKREMIYINFLAANAYILYEAACGNIKTQDVLNAAEAKDGRERPVA